MKLLIIICLLMTSNAHAIDMKKIDSILKNEKATLRLRDWQSVFNETLKEKSKNNAIEPENAQKVRKLAKRIYVTPNLKEIYRLALAKELVDMDVKKISEWQETAIGKLVLKNLSSYFRKDIDHRTKAFFGNNKMNNNRLNTLKSCFLAIKLMKQESEKRVMADYGIEMALNGYRPSAERTDEDTIKSTLESKRLHYERRVEETHFKYFAYAMRKLTDRQIDAYRKFAETNSGSRFYKAQLKALQVTGTRAGKTILNAAIKNL